jgi:hypothetical protein
VRRRSAPRPPLTAIASNSETDAANRTLCTLCYPIPPPQSQLGDFALACPRRLHLPRTKPFSHLQSVPRTLRNHPESALCQSASSLFLLLSCFSSSSISARNRPAEPHIVHEFPPRLVAIATDIPSHLRHLYKHHCPQSPARDDHPTTALSCASR